MQGLQLNAENPVNSDFPLNDGKTFWALTVPHLYGGPTWVNLIAGTLQASGMLTSMGNANNGWRPTTRPGGFGHVLFDGTAGYVSGPSIVPPQSGFAAFIWMLPSSVRTQLLFSIYNAPTSSYCQLLGDSGGAIHGRIFQSPNANWIGRTSASSAYGAAKWSRIGMIWSGGTTNSAIRVYLNGSRIDTTNDSSGTFTAPSSTASPSVIGGQFSSGIDSGTLFGGGLDDAGEWGANPLAISNPDAFAALDYDQSLRGYPDALNWLTRPQTLWAPASSSTYFLTKNQMAGSFDSMGF